MPYAIRGNKVVKKNTGRVVGKSKNPKKYLRKLNMIEHDSNSNKVKGSFYPSQS